MIKKSTTRLRVSTSFFIVLLLAVISADAQLNNLGGVITIANGASIICAGNVTNTSGTITNNGTLEIRNSFNNTGTYNSTSNDDSLLLTGIGSATLNGGSAAFNYLQINKSSGGITLTGNTTVAKKFDFLAGTFSTDPTTSSELIASVTTTLSFGAGTEIVGKVRRTGWVTATPVIFNNASMILTTNGGTAPSAMLVSMVPNGDPTGAEREVKRAFTVTPVGGSNYTADISFPYTAAEVNTNAEENLVPWFLQSGEWNARLTGNAVNTQSHLMTTTGISAAALASSEWKLADPKYTFDVTTLLRGAWNGVTMNTTLNAAGLLPLAQPYNTTPFNYTGAESVTAIPNANVVDWVLLELRKPASGLAADASSSTVVGRRAAFLTNTGSIVDLDGVSPVSFSIIKQGNSFVVVSHRNHLPVMSNAIPSNATGTFANDFSSSANSYRNPSSASDPVILLSGGIKYGLWSGDANKSAVINSTDISVIKAAIANSANGYLLSDVNLSNSINSTDVSLTKATISASGSGSTAARQAATDKTVKSNVPD